MRLLFRLKLIWNLLQGSVIYPLIFVLPFYLSIRQNSLCGPTSVLALKGKYQFFFFQFWQAHRKFCRNYKAQTKRVQSEFLFLFFEFGRTYFPGWMTITCFHVGSLGTSQSTAMFVGPRFIALEWTCQEHKIRMTSLNDIFRQSLRYSTLQISYNKWLTMK